MTQRVGTEEGEVILTEDKRVDLEASKNQMTIRDERIKEDYVYIEKFVHSTYKQHVFIHEEDEKF
jgi:hypothetical protein